MTGKDAAWAVLSVALGLAIGWLDLQVTEVTVTIVALVAAGLLLGLFRPVAAWRWPLLIVIGLPLMAAVAGTLGWRTAEPIRPDFRVMLVALAFALLGTYVGVAVRRTVRGLTGRDRQVS